MALRSFPSGHDAPPRCPVRAATAAARLLAGLLGLALVLPGALAQQTNAEQEQKEREKEPKVLVATLEQMDQRLKSGRVDLEMLAAWVKVIESIKPAASKCVPAAEANLKKLETNLGTLGYPTKGEPAEVVRQRNELNQQKTEAENRLATCKVLILRSDELLPKIAALQKRFQARRLLARGPAISAVLADEAVQLDLWVVQGWTFLRSESALAPMRPAQWMALAAALAAALVLGVALRRLLSAWSGRHRWQRSLSSTLGYALMTSLGHYAPHLLLGLGAAGFFFLVTRDIEPLPLATLVAYGLPPYFLMLSAVRVFIAPYPPAETFLPLPPGIARTLATRLKVFMTLVLLATVVFTTFEAHAVSEAITLVTRTALAVAFFVNLTWMLWLLVRIPVLAHVAWVYIGLMLVVAGAMAAELIGLRNLSLTAIWSVAGTLAALGVFGLLRRLVSELFDGLNTGRHPWHRRIRQALALNADDPVPGLVWVRVITAVFLWAVLVVVLLRLWGVPQQYFDQLFAWATSGFTVGSLRVNPTRILLAVVTLTVVLAASGWIRSRLKRRWLTKTRMDRGAREATLTMIGYLSVAIAVLLALAVSGFEFTSLAIIAGALSVGIGFGLQNIVNNFVSGLILLFERPIRTGDWIVVGTTEGYVKKISIRSTLIQTFDRADVIVPNSDLVSNQVTNWMLYDPYGRIRVPVAVAHGSDTEKVRNVLLEVARAHPDVLSDGSVPEPRVLFMGFGESALNMELWCHIRNIDMRRLVISDLNFAIDKAFREQGIKIPFPQRDIHVHDWTAVTTRTRASAAAPNPNPNPNPEGKN